MITMIQPKLYARKDVDYGINLQGGDLFWKQGLQESSYRLGTVNKTGGRLTYRNGEFGGVQNN